MCGGEAGVTRWKLESQDGGRGHEMCCVEVWGHEMEAAVTGYVAMKQRSRDVRQSGSGHEMEAQVTRWRLRSRDPGSGHEMGGDEAWGHDMCGSEAVVTRRRLRSRDVWC